MADWFSLSRANEPKGTSSYVFDNERFVTPTAAPFDAGRFGSQPQTPVAFDLGRFGDPYAGPTRPAGNYADLRPDLQADYERARGILGMDPIGPLLSSMPTSPRSPGQNAISVVSPQPATPAAPIGGQSARSAGRSMSAPAVNTGFMGRNNPALNDFGPTGRGLLGGLGGAILGGALLGPVGGIVGGLLGKNYGQTSYYPSAPAPIPGQPQNSGGGYESLSDYGQQAYSDSPQFAGAVDSGSVGLW